MTVKRCSEVLSRVPNPVIAKIPRQKSPEILPEAAKIDFFQPCEVELVIINKTAGPGEEVAIITKVTYISQVCRVILSSFFYTFCFQSASACW